MATHYARGSVRISGTPVTPKQMEGAKFLAILVNTRDTRVQNLAMCSFTV